ncbi:MAG TPA: hypothetical protein DEF18_16100 [Muricauda sp.]|nr:hypothetical protein [uncultured Allomuricauda sp.]MAO18021.1 hypothetical protein [Allomuricauda sp.]MBC72501.1 hypothetical protein [Allomuricauda sp.]HBU79620.1 hypothetical protein [Allomuricauda sp.]|tara:strand:- start:8935 stop:9243 length:309 start_codon:yes stop_codon:yes gene_type:complete
MKHFIPHRILSFLFVTLFLGACETSKDSTDMYIITRVKAEKDGQTLFLKGKGGEVYTTVISIPNGNFIEVKEGDQVKLEVEEILDTDPPIIISKSVSLVPSE